jgi:hypothetical protein
LVSADAIANAKSAVSEMNTFIKKAVKELGLANDGIVSKADVREINLYLIENHSDQWADLVADYRALQPKLRKKQRRIPRVIAMNHSAINLWGDVYSIGLENAGRSKGKHIRRYFNRVGYTLGELLKGNVESGELHNPDFQEVVGTTGTAMDKSVEIILNDPGLQRRIPTSDLRAGAQNANEMNKLILEAIIAEGLANDGKISTADVRNINHYLVTRYAERWHVLHGDDEKGEETGYHKVQNDGAFTRMFADNFINNVADGVYHLGYPTRFKNNLENEDGNKNKRFEKVAWWLDSCLKKDMEEGKLKNTAYKEVVGTTGTTFDNVISLIYSDPGLEIRVSMEDIREGARAANGMNELLVEAIKVTGVAKDDHISTDDVRELNQYLVTHHATEWAELHGDDENGEETGYHRVQNDGAITVAYGKNVLNRLADGVYHLGFPTRFKHRLENEDGNKNVSFRSVSYWLNKSLQNDYVSGVLK